MYVFHTQPVMHYNRQSESVHMFISHVTWHRAATCWSHYIHTNDSCTDVFHFRWWSGRERLSDFNFLITLMNPDPCWEKHWEQADKQKLSDGALLERNGQKIRQKPLHLPPLQETRTLTEICITAMQFISLCYYICLCAGDIKICDKLMIPCSVISCRGMM